MENRSERNDIKCQHIINFFLSYGITLENFPNVDKPEAIPDLFKVIFPPAFYELSEMLLAHHDVSLSACDVVEVSQTTFI